MSNTPDKLRLQELAHKWLNGTLDKAEQLEFDEWFCIVNDEPLEVPSLITSREEEFENILFNKIQQQIKAGQQRKVVKLWSRIAVAASILLCLSVGGYFLIHKQTTQQTAAIKPGTFKNDVEPGGNNATVTLSNGQQIVIKNAKNGLLANQGSTQIQKLNDGTLKYAATGNGNSSKEIIYNTVTTKRANKVDLTLPDGTIAYLDAASSIHFPTSFTRNSRDVSVTGQVYFEVAHDKTKPFHVTFKGVTIEVLGTHFNINAYDDEATTKTTLLEGSVKITFNGQAALLKPGQQAQITAHSNKINVTQPDLDEVMAWQNGLFKFNNTDIQTTMRQLTRWYDVDVIYEGSNKDYHFGGYIPRNSKLSEALRILQLSGVKFSIDGKKIIVYQ